LAPNELNGALYSSAHQDFYILPDLVENLRSLIASQYAEADCTICGRGNFILRLSHQKHRLSVADWKALSEPQQQRVRHAVFSLACEGVAAWHTAINIYRWQPDRPAPSKNPDAGKKLGSLAVLCGI